MCSQINESEEAFKVPLLPQTTQIVFSTHLGTRRPTHGGTRTKRHIWHSQDNESS